MAALDITFSYSGGEELFSSFSLSIEEGEHVLIIAPPGSGKTTLSRILTGSVPKYRQGCLSGSFLYGGKDVFALDIPERLKIVGRVSQNNDEMLLFSSVEEELSFPLENLGIRREEREKRIKKALSLFGLEPYQEVSTSELSGGEKRRLMLSVLFAIDPAIYVLDESFDELSPMWRDKLSQMIKSLDRTVIAFGSHMLGEYKGVFNRILTIKDGKAVPYIEERNDIPHFQIKTSDTTLSVRDLLVERLHRSADFPVFTLSVPFLDIKKGECITLIGENGSGKSTFSKVLSGLLKEKSGKVMIDRSPLSYKARRHTIAYVMQNPYEALFLPTVRDELESTGAEQSKIEEVAALFSLDFNDYVQEMSYGKAKLLQAAIFFLLDRPFVIFDEIDSALSFEDFLRVISAFLDKGCGLIVITHDMKNASLLPGRKLMIEEGLLHEC